MSETRLNAINCTTCGAALPALAGHRAKALVCTYCGSVMDRHDDYKVLARYRDMPRPEGPFSIGMTGHLFGIEHTVIGIVGVYTIIDQEFYRWTNYQMFSSTHGYSWVTWNDGHLTHSRRVRSATELEPSYGFAAKAEFVAGDRVYKMFEAYIARIDYIEGELTWVPKLGNEFTVVEGIDPPFGFSMARTGEEIEYEAQTYLDRDATLASFGIEDTLPPKQGVHAIQPFEPGKLHTALSDVAMWFVPIIGLAALALLNFGGGTTVANTTLQEPTRGGELSFEAPSANRLMSIRLHSPLSNNWAYYDMTLTHDESDEEVAEFGKELEFYQGYDSDGSWSEGSQTATLRFRPPQAGKYTLEIVESADSPGRRPLHIEVRKNVFVARYFIILTVICLALFGSLWIRSAKFEAARWGTEGYFDFDDD